jgi:hypothetical protein
MIVSKRFLIDRGLWSLWCELTGTAEWESAENVEPIRLSNDQMACFGLAEIPSPARWDPFVSPWIDRGCSPLHRILAKWLAIRTMLLNSIR